MKEYKLSKGYTIFAYIAIPLMLVVFGGLLLEPLFPGMNNQNSSNIYYIMAPISIAVIVLLIMALRDAIKGRFVIDKDRVFTAGSFSNRELLFGDIKGYRLDDKYIYIEPNVEGKKRIRISTYYGNTDEIIKWLSVRYPDLNVLNAEKEQQEILQNEAFGETKDQREEKLKQVQTVTKALNWIGGIVAGWLLFWPNPYEFAMLAAIAVPIFAIAVLKYYNGLVRVGESKESAYPSIFVCIFAPGFAIFIRTFLDFDIFDYSNVWKPAILIAVVFMMLLLMGNKTFSIKQPKSFVTIFTVVLVASAYSVGSVVALNCYFDKSEPELYNANILSKRISTGKTTSYYFELSPWGSRKENKEVSVPKDLYNILEKDNQVNIYFKKGKFQIPWFIVTE